MKFIGYWIPWKIKVKLGATLAIMNYFFNNLCSFGQFSCRPGATGPVHTLALLDMGKSSGIFMKSWNYRIVWFGRDLKDHLCEQAWLRKPKPVLGNTALTFILPSDSELLQAVKSQFPFSQPSPAWLSLFPFAVPRGKSPGKRLEQIGRLS